MRPRHHVRTHRIPLLSIGLLLSALAFPVPAGAVPRVEFHPNGKIHFERNLDAQGLPHGLSREFDDKGRLVAERHYLHGKLEGISRLYYPSGQLMTEWTYKDGKREGPSVGYYPNGKLKDRGNYRDDELDGPVRMYYREGTLRSEMNFKNNRLEGTGTTFYRDGTLESESTYWKGLLRNRKTYDRKGTLIQDQDFPLPSVPP